MIARLAVVVALLSSAAATGAEDTRALGSRLSDLARAAYTCTATEAVTTCRAVGGEIRHLDVPAEAMTLEYRNELLRRITVMFNELYFPAVTDQLQLRLGEAMPHDERLRSGMSGSVVNRVRVWHSGEGVVMLEQFSGKITRSALRYLTDQDFDELMRDRNARRVRGMRDL